MQVIAVADPAERWNLDAFYYKGDAGRKPVRAEIEKHYAAKTPNFRCAEYAAGHVVVLNRSDTLADGMAVRQPDPAAFEIIRRGVSRIVCVSDAEIGGESGLTGPIRIIWLKVRARRRWRRFCRNGSA